MRLAAVIEVLDALDVAAVPHWVAGGWGVDALVGRQTREHRDLDLLVDAEHHEPCLATLADLGYAVETDELPMRVEVRADGDRWVDVHPVRFDARGHGVQGDPAGTHFRYPPDVLVTGTIAGRTVPCTSREHQLGAHTGYPPRPQDDHDVVLLRALAARG